jgi:predicted ABC-type ATPase
MARRRRQPRCIIIAGPNGAGKTTFARRYLPENARVLHFVNADLIASGLSPLRPELAAFAAARTVIEEIDRMATARWDFGFETTFSAHCSPSAAGRSRCPGFGCGTALRAQLG